MSKKKNQQVGPVSAPRAPKYEVTPVVIEFSVVGNLTKDGVFVDHVVAKDKISEINFNGASVQDIVDRAGAALTEKYCNGGK